MDKRLRMVQEEALHKSSQQTPQQYYEHKRHISEPRYHYTRQSGATPIRDQVPGQSNIAMTYSGPPNNAEMMRN